MLGSTLHLEARAFREAYASARGPVFVSVVGLFVLGVFYTLYFAAPILLPLAFSFLLAFLLAPAVQRVQRIGIPRFVAAGVLVGFIVGAVSFGAYSLSGAAAQWLREAPTSINEVRDKFEGLGTPLADVREAAQAVEDAVQGISGQSQAESREVVQIEESGWLDPVIGRIPNLIGGFAAAMLLTVFLLIWADELTAGFAALRRGYGVRRQTVVTIYHVQRDVARYLVTVTVINALLGIVVWLALLWVGMPNAPLWGTLAGVANFAPYVGPVCTAAALLLAGANAFDTWQAALIPSLVFCAITAVEGQILTPAVLGHRLAVPPPVVFAAVLVFGWLWGVVGALIAVPIIVVLKRLWLQAGSNRQKRRARSAAFRPGIRPDQSGNVITITSE